MSYDSSTDLKQIQKDVLTTDLTANTLISRASQLKTQSSRITKAINELQSRLDSSLNYATDASQKVDAIQENITNIVKEQITSIVSGGIQSDEFIPAENQNKFTLTKTPADPDNIMFFVNGVKYLKVDRSYSATDNSVTWTGQKSETRPKGFNLATTDEISIVYMAKS